MIGSLERIILFYKMMGKKAYREMKHYYKSGKGIIPRKQIKNSTEHISTAETLVGYKKLKK